MAIESTVYNGRDAFDLPLLLLECETSNSCEVDHRIELLHAGTSHIQVSLSVIMHMDNVVIASRHVAIFSLALSCSLLVSTQERVVRHAMDQLLAVETNEPMSTPKHMPDRSFRRPCQMACLIVHSSQYLEGYDPLKKAPRGPPEMHCG